MIYLIYRFIINDGFNKVETILLIGATIVGVINSLVVFYRRKNKNHEK
jgi:hypothetical protein